MSKKTIPSLILLITISFTLGACIQDGRLTDLEGRPIVHTEGEIQQAQIKLSKMRSITDVSDKTEGVAVFEGIVMSAERVHTLKGRFDGDWIEARFLVENAIFGVERGAPTIIVASPTGREMEGVVFDVGKRYRVLAWIFEDRYMTWAWLGTYAIHE